MKTPIQARTNILVLLLFLRQGEYNLLHHYKDDDLPNILQESILGTLLPPSQEFLHTDHISDAMPLQLESATNGNLEVLLETLPLFAIPAGKYAPQLSNLF